MEPNIVVKIPDKCYITPNPNKEFPGKFFFSVHQGFLNPRIVRPCEKDSSEELEINRQKGPQITITGFDQLLETSQIMDFASNLSKSSDDWIVKKSDTSSNIIIKYTGEGLSPDFSFLAETDQFKSSAKANKNITLAVEVKNFEGIEDHQYCIPIKIDYGPWAKSLKCDKAPVPLNSKVEISYEYDGDGVDKILSKNGADVNTSSSPCVVLIDKPSNFKLEVSNNFGLFDSIGYFLDVEPPQILSFNSDRTYFHKDESVNLTWSLKSFSNVQLDNPGHKDVISDNCAEVFPVTNPGERNVYYTLRANGYKNGNPYSCPKTIRLTETYWKNTGKAAGYFSGDAFSKTDYNSRLFLHKGHLYCYAHPWIYQSKDGQSWTEFSENKVSEADFICIAADYYNSMLYVMGKKGDTGDRLVIATFNYDNSEWKSSPAKQSCTSNIGGFAFTSDSKQYMQVQSGGLSIVCEKGGFWNIGNNTISADEGCKVISGDYCFFKNTYYAVMLCEDGQILVYDCNDNNNDVLFTHQTDARDRFISLIQTRNRLYLVTNSTIIDIKTQEILDYFLPNLENKTSRPWLGVDSNGFFTGIYPDKHIWTFKK